MPGILFVCTGNTCRSSMAAAIAVHLAKERGMDIPVSSAGIAARAGEPATPAAVAALAAMGIDLAEHRARRLEAAMVNSADVILAMTAAHKEYIRHLFPAAAAKTYTLKEYARDEGTATGSEVKDDLDIPDPFGSGPELYRSMARELSELVSRVLEKYRQQNEK
jgi:protein-tyrosine-phosphatase